MEFALAQAIFQQRNPIITRFFPGQTGTDALRELLISPCHDIPLSQFSIHSFLLRHSFFSLLLHQKLAKMPTKSHHRSRSSVDQVISLLADLPEHQIALLLEDFNSTTSSNVPVSKAIALFDPASPKPKRIFSQKASPVKKLEAELVRRHSKRISSAPEPVMRPRAASPPPTVEKPQPTLPAEPAEVTETKDLPQERSIRPSLSLSPPDCVERPQTADGPARESRARSYKRISRPLILSPTATAELHQLLLAYLCETPSSGSGSSTATSSPVTPDAATPFSFFSPLVSDKDIPGLDLLEPSPLRTPHFTFGRGGKRSVENMSGIFEVLSFD